ncbi:lytic transglycosylase, partial [Xanthomonas euvesicatoria]
KEPAVKVQLVTPGAAPAVAAAPAERVQTQRQAQAVPVQRATANSTQQDAPFVQFVH